MNKILELSKLLYCCSLLERKVAKAYEHIAKLIDDENISSLFIFIAYDSLKHAEYFKKINESLMISKEINFEECEEILGECWRSAINSAEKILKKDKIDIKEIISLIDELKQLESFAGEEYLMILYIKYAELLLDNIISIPTKTIFEWIIEDEKRHEKILEIIRNRLTYRI